MFIKIIHAELLKVTCQKNITSKILFAIHMNNKFCDKFKQKIIEKIFFHISQKKTCCDSSLEPSQQDGSNDGSQNMCL